ncbi:MAG: UDP-3-O-(3-hydroxymyristoyl)glucosamine N-acyltransferase [Verrucomicrobiales bacterium]|nr:UDP-3-O-(3-hydroxymyristoyl)glucosamine N-acyltransferase [Verrucomicrobiales bacterium]
MQIKISEIASKLGADVINAPSEEAFINGLAALAEAGPQDLSFFHHKKYLNDLRTTEAGAVLVPEGLNEVIEQVPLIKVKSPSLAFNEIAKELYESDGEQKNLGVHETAVIGDDVKMDSNSVSIGPHVVVGSGTKIGKGSVISAGVRIGSEVNIGEDCTLFPNVVVYKNSMISNRVIIHGGSVIGSDGFGYEFDGSTHQKIVHFGHVEIGSDVEIGANCTIDRGRFGKTLIGEGTKIDNLCQVGHNVIIGKHCIIVADTAIGGSSKIGDYVTMAAQVGIAGHLEVGAHSVLVARTGVTKSLPGGEPGKPAFYSSFPAGPHEVKRKEMVYPRKIPKVLSRLKSIEDRLSEGGI